jgi:hypothetical protein
MIKTLSVTIASGQSLSGAAGIGDYAVVGVIMPVAWDAANLTFQGAQESSGTFGNLYDEAGSELTVTAAAGRSIVMTGTKKDVLGGFPWIKVRSGTSGAPVNQTANRTIILLLKKNIYTS